jgi:hypothetical protein
VPLSLEGIEEEQKRATTSVNESYHRPAWDLTLTMKRFLMPSIWKEKWGEINSVVFTSRAEFQPGGRERVKVEGEAPWKFDARAKFGRLLQVPS